MSHRTLLASRRRVLLIAGPIRGASTRSLPRGGADSGSAHARAGSGGAGAGAAGGAARTASRPARLSTVAAASSSSSTVREEAPLQLLSSSSSWPSAAARQAAFTAASRREAADVPATVAGRLPPWLKGAYLRNGPGDYEFGALHMFDGMALLLRFDIDGASNSVAASHRFLDSASDRAVQATGHLRWREFGTPVSHLTLLSRLGGYLQTMLGALGLVEFGTDNASVSLLARPDGGVWALTETLAGTYAIDPSTLQTLQRVRCCCCQLEGWITGLMLVSRAVTVLGCGTAAEGPNQWLPKRSHTTVAPPLQAPPVFGIQCLSKECADPLCSCHDPIIMIRSSLQTGWAATSPPHTPRCSPAEMSSTWSQT